MAAEKKFVPGVGYYKDADRAYNNYSVIEKPRVVKIMKNAL